MIILLSPSKTLDLSRDNILEEFTTPKLLENTKELVNEFKQYSVNDLSKMMKISDKIAQVNYERFQNFKFPFNLDNSKQALLSFKGDVYKNIDVANYSKNDISFAQQNIIILSGLYGILKPLDLIQPYRLEMHLKTKYWKEKITTYFIENLKDNEVIINLASKEYSNAIDMNKIPNKVINCVFKEFKDEKYKIIAIYAKIARGTMTNYIIKNKITNIEKIKEFNEDGYKYNEKMSTENEFLFLRKR